MDSFEEYKEVPVELPFLVRLGDYLLGVGQDVIAAIMANPLTTCFVVVAGVAIGLCWWVGPTKFFLYFTPLYNMLPIKVQGFLSAMRGKITAFMAYCSDALTAALRSYGVLAVAIATVTVPVTLTLARTALGLRDRRRRLEEARNDEDKIMELASGLAAEDEDDEIYICPISFSLATDPVKVRQGRVMKYFQRAELENWRTACERRSVPFRNPLTGRELVFADPLDANGNWATNVEARDRVALLLATVMDSINPAVSEGAVVANALKNTALDMLAVGTTVCVLTNPGVAVLGAVVGGVVSSLQNNMPPQDENEFVISQQVVEEAAEEESDDDEELLLPVPPVVEEDVVLAGF